MKKYPNRPILLVDDDEQFLDTAEISLQQEGIDNIVLCNDSRQVMTLLSNHNVGVVALDLTMPYLSGRELLNMISNDYPDTIVIIITASNNIETAVQCIKSGSFDYVVKPVGKGRLVTSIKSAIRYREIIMETESLKQYVLTDRIERPEAFSKIVTNHKSMLNIFKYTEAIAQADLPVLITGETGVGKGMLVEAIHHLSSRTGEFIPVNISGLDEAMFSDTLFGHTTGAFTGAQNSRSGLIEQAGTGTLFLDEIGDLSTESQVKLLSLLQDGTFLPVGSDIQKRSSARIIAATNKDIKAKQEEGKFRKDLYYRLQSHHIHIPPLRERMSDLEMLFDFFLGEAAEKLHKKKPTPPNELPDLLNTYHFPGNVRELRGMIFDAVSCHKSGVLSLETFKSKINSCRDNQITALAAADAKNKNGHFIGTNNNFLTIKQMEEMHVVEALRRAKGNKTLAAQLLGIKRQSLQAKLRKKNRDNSLFENELSTKSLQ